MYGLVLPDKRLTMVADTPPQSTVYEEDGAQIQGAVVELSGPLPGRILGVPLRYDAALGVYHDPADVTAQQTSADAAAAEVDDLAEDIVTAMQWLDQIETQAAQDETITLANLAAGQAAIRRIATALKRLAIIDRRVVRLVSRHLAGTAAP